MIRPKYQVTRAGSANWSLVGGTSSCYLSLRRRLASGLVTDHGTRLHALVANESATQESFHEGDRVYCSLHLDDLVIVQAE